MSIVLMIYLFVISVWDIMRKSISLGLLITGGAFGVIMGAIRVYRMNVSWGMLFAGIFPGLVFLLISFLSRMMGYGDGVVLCAVGAFVGFRKCMALIGISLFMIAVFCVIMLILRKVKKTTQIPYIPFLFVAFLLVGG